jgi:hypothetical protein
MHDLIPTLRRAGTVTFAVVAVAAIVAAPVVAGPLVREHRTGGDSYSEELCGEEWTVESSFEAVFMLKSGRHGDPTPFFFNLERYANVYTDPADATRGFVISGHSLFKDLRITRLSGTVYRFDSIQVGQPMVISSLNGKVVARDRGRLAMSFLVDTHGSSNPEDYELLDIGPTSVSGPHPIAESMCAFVVEALDG